MAQQPDIEERWLEEYFEFGWADLVAYLAKWSRFWLWCQTHNREEA